MPRMNVSGASAIVTGGASGIGEGSARQLAALGAHVVIADLQEEQGAKVASEIGGLFVKCDVSSEEDGAAAVAAASELGPLRALVNSAGLGRAGRTVDRNNDPMPQSVFEFVIKVNLLGTFNMLRLSAAAMAKTDPLDDDGARGAIVNMASVAAFDGQTGQASYSASKGGIVGMTLPIARDLSGTGERADAFKAHLGESVLFPKRLGFAEELAFMVIELLTNPYMNGETIRVDGGIRLPPK
jgi:NAD(P)-dependent dehydrogenase (short-subunit alcohol dehydrogenase family)